MANARASWTGIVQFGLLAIGVQLLPCSADPDPPFVSVHAKDLKPVKQIKICSGTSCSVTLSAGDIAQAVTMSGGGHSLVTPEELEAIAPASRKVVVLDRFARRDGLRLIAHERSYNVLPAGDDRHAYSLLNRVLDATNRAALGKISFRGRERIAAFVVEDEELLLHVLRFPSEIRECIYPPLAPVSGDELRLAEQFVDQTNKKAGASTADSCHLYRYTDDYTDQLEALIRIKRGTDIPHPALSTTLKASVTRAKRSANRKAS